MSQQERTTEAGRARACPRCRSRDVAEIVYGYPMWDDTWEANTRAGEWAVGGCVVSPGQPDFRCNVCRALFREDGMVVLDPEEDGPFAD
jgi:hypothetical protein